MAIQDRDPSSGLRYWTELNQQLGETLFNESWRHLLTTNQDPALCVNRPGVNWSLCYMSWVSTGRRSPGEAGPDSGNTTHWLILQNMRGVRKHLD